MATSEILSILPIIFPIFLSIFAFFLTVKCIPKAIATFVAAGRSGRDLSKRNVVIVPESMGFISGTIFFFVMFINLGVKFIFFVARNSNSISPKEFPYLRYVEFITALLCICCMLALGLADDVFNLKWRFKLFFPMVASMPLLIVYYINGGGTRMVIPKILHCITPPSIDIGFIYYFYMLLLAVFCTNSINIYAGVNGLESGQTLVIAISVAIFNLTQFGSFLSELHAFSFSIMLPFAGTTAALFVYNKYPSRVFVGDTFTYYAGITFAVVSIIGHFSKTMLLFFIPQIFNFLYSTPQIFKVGVPCPRHRVPFYNKATDKLEPSVVKFKKNSLPWPVLKFRIFEILNKLRLVKYEEIHDSEGNVTINNLTLINLVLVWTGPLNEGTLTNVLLLIQILGTCLAFFIRYPLANYFYS